VIDRTIAFTLTRNPEPNFVIDSRCVLLLNWLPTGWRAGDAGRSANNKEAQNV